MPRTPRLLALLAIALAVPGCGDGVAATALRISAAASLRELAGELADAFERREAAAVELNLAGSNTLAQQILAAPGADVFLSADRYWVEALERAGRTVPDSRRPVLSNRLVLIERAGADSGIARPAELAGGGYRRLALADPQAVPAGRYARAALSEIDTGRASLWQLVAERVVPALDVRAALALVESDPEILGIVYRTDALSSSRVRVLCEFPDRGPAAVTYWAVRLADGRSPELAGRFVEFLETPAARAIAERRGFGVPADRPPAPAETGS